MNRIILIFVFLALGFAPAALAQEIDFSKPMVLFAHPFFRDMDYSRTVIAVWPFMQLGGHIGVIVNRPTSRSVSSFFPQHEPSKKIVEPAFYGGPFGNRAMIAIVKQEFPPGVFSLQLANDLYLAYRKNEIDHVIEKTPNDARYFVGRVIWEPGQLA